MSNTNDTKREAELAILRIQYADELRAFEAAIAAFRHSAEQQEAARRELGDNPPQPLSLDECIARAKAHVARLREGRALADGEGSGDAD